MSNNKNHIYKVILLATFLFFGFVTLEGQELSLLQRKQLEENVDTFQVFETHEREIELFLPWLQIGSYTLIILNNGMQIVSRIKKKE